MLKVNKIDLFYLMLYAVANTLLNFTIIYIINNVLSGNKAFLNDYMLIVFVSMIVYAYLLNIIFQKRLNKFTFRILYKNEKRLFDQIIKAPLEAIEKFGSERFYTAMEDLRVFSILPTAVTHTINSILILILGIFYLFSLSGKSAAIVVVMIILVAAIYFIVKNFM